MGLSETQWTALLRIVGLNDDRPPVLLRQSGSIEDGSKWLDNHASALMTALPRFVENTDLTVAFFPSEILDLRQNQSTSGAQLIFEPHDGLLSPTATDLRLDILSAAGLTFFQLYADVASPAAMLDSDSPPPDVKVEKGSVQYSFGGSSLLISGVSLVIACSAGLVASPYAIVGGLGLATIGMVDQIINWRKTRADTRAAKSLISKSDLEKQKLELEIREKELDLRQRSIGLDSQNPRDDEEAKRYIQERLDKVRSLDTRSLPPSSMVPYEFVAEVAKEEGISVGLAHHLLNRALPAFVALKPYFQHIRISKQAVVRKHPTAELHLSDRTTPLGESKHLNR
jgi:hypothetical protein